MTFRLQSRVQKHGTKGSWELGCCSRMYDVFSLFSLKGSEIKGFILALKQLFVVPLRNHRIISQPRAVLEHLKWNPQHNETKEADNEFHYRKST